MIKTRASPGDGELEGSELGIFDGIKLGSALGKTLGKLLGCKLGTLEGSKLGTLDGITLGIVLGKALPPNECHCLGVISLTFAASMSQSAGSQTAFALQ